MAATGVSLVGRAANMRPIMPWHIRGKDNSSWSFLFLGLNRCSTYMCGFAAFLPPVQGAAGLRVCRVAMTWPATVGSTINLSGGGRGAMPTVCGTCAGAVVVTIMECVLARTSPVPCLGRFVGCHTGLSVGGQRALGRDGEADTDGVMCQPDWVACWLCIPANTALDSMASCSSIRLIRWLDRLCWGGDEESLFATIRGPRRGVDGDVGELWAILVRFLRRRGGSVCGLARAEGLPRRFPAVLLAGVSSSAILDLVFGGMLKVWCVHPTWVLGFPCKYLRYQDWRPGTLYPLATPDRHHR